MPVPAIALKLKRFRRRFGIAAPRVVVRGHLPWQWLAVGLLLILLFMLGAVSLFYKTSEVHLLDRELDALRLKVGQQGEELLLLRGVAGTEQNVVLMEKTAQQQLLSRIRSLESENASLKEDVRLFERLIPVPGEGGAIRIENFRVTSEGDGRFRYRLLLAYQPDKQLQEFSGRLQFVVVFTLAGKEQKLSLPDKQEGLAYQIQLKHFLRREGVFLLPVGSGVKEVEARVLAGDTLKAKRLAQL